MYMSPKVSIIIPCYNYGKFLDKAVDSVLNQTFQDFEIIIINDGSTDDYTNKLLSNYQKPKTKVITIQNSGVSKARNIGISEAQGEYIFPLDADDYIEREYLEKASKILDEKSNVGIVTANHRKVGAKHYTTIYTYNFPDILVNNTIHNSSLFRKSDWEKIKGYKENMMHGLEDHDFWLSIIGLGREVIHLPDVFINYRMHGNILSRQNAITEVQFPALL